MKYIALDIGNVICHADMTKFIDDISSTFNIPVVEATHWLRSFQQVHDLGLTTMENQLRGHFGCRSEPTIARLIDHWNSMIYPNKDVLDFLNGLEKQEVKIALLSNIGVEHAEMMPDRLGDLYHRSTKHFSCFVGARKPTLMYYQSFLLQYPEFKGCIYVDDLVINLEASKQLGFQTVHMSLEKDDVDYKLSLLSQLLMGGEGLNLPQIVPVPDIFNKEEPDKG